MRSTNKKMDEWLQYLLTTHPLSMEFTLERIESVYNRLDIGTLAPLVISVAGTNGKGSTATTASYLFEAHGAKVGLFTSPHIFQFNERIRINQIPMDDPSIIDAFEAIETARQEIPLTYFEFATLAAFYLFKREKVDVAVLEIGLGGRLDSTNIVDADIALITPIGIDHTAILGDTLDAIASEKAGIIKPHAKAVTAEAHPSIAIIEKAKEVDASLAIQGRDYQYTIFDNGAWEYQHQTHSPLQLLAPKLVGTHQYQNAATAITALYLSNYAPNEAFINQALQSVQLLGRFQKMVSPNHPDLYLDVTHNPQGATILRETLRHLPKKGRIIAIYGALKDKDAKEVAFILNDTVDQWICTSLEEGERSQNAQALAKRIEGSISTPLIIENSIESACKKALSLATKDDILILFGSFHMIDKGINWFNRHDYE